MNNEQRQIYYWAHMLDEAFFKETDWSSVSKDYFGRRDKQDEWYTSPENAKKIIEPFKDHLSGKKIYCNCDNPEWSGVYKALYDNFNKWNLAKLVCTGYGARYKAIVTPETYDDISKILQENPGNGDMNSKDSLKEAREADIIISNPPFSRPEHADDNLFRNWIKIAFQCNCDLIGIGMTRSVKEDFIKDKILSGQLFVYYCPRYKFGRSGENIENADGQKKDTVQVSIYSTFDEDLQYGPKLKLNSHSYLDDLPKTIWNGQPIPVTVNDQHLIDADGKAVKDDAFSRSIIPPATKKNLGKLIVVPFNVIDLNWKDYFNLEDFIVSPIVTLANGEKKNISSALVLRYKIANAPEQDEDVFIKNLNDNNFDDVVRKAKIQIDHLATSKDLEQLRNERLKYFNKYKAWKDKPGLKQRFYKKMYDYAGKSVKLLTGYVSTVEDFVNRAYSIYNTSKMTIDEKLKNISALNKKIIHRRSLKKHEDKNIYGVGKHMTIEEIESVSQLVQLISSCLKFNQKYDKFNNMMRKEKNGSKYDAFDALNAKKQLEEFYQADIYSYFDNIHVVPNLKKEMQYKIQRISDQTSNVEERLPFKTVGSYEKKFINITGYNIDQFNDNALASLSKDAVKNMYDSLSKLRPTVGMYINDLNKHPDRYEPDVYNKVMQKAIEIKTAISNALKICKAYC